MKLEAEGLRVPTSTKLGQRYMARVGMCIWRQGRWGFGLTLTKRIERCALRRGRLPANMRPSSMRPSRADSTGAVASKSRPLFNSSQRYSTLHPCSFLRWLSMIYLFYYEYLGQRMAIAVASCLTQLQKRMQARTSMNCFKSHLTQTLRSHVFDDILYLVFFLLLSPILSSCFASLSHFVLPLQSLYSVLIFEAPSTFYYPINIYKMCSM